MVSLRRAVLILIAAGLVGPATADAQRVPVAVVGDSIVEASHPGVTPEQGLMAQLGAQLSRRGFDPGAGGFVASHPAQIAPVIVRPPAVGEWRYDGPWAWLTRTPNTPAPIVSWTANGAASATLPTTGAESATLVYLQGPWQGEFTVSAGGARARVASHSDEPGVGMHTVPLDPAAGTPLQVGEAADGGIGLVGAFLRRAPQPGRTQVELTAVAAGGAQAADPTTPAEDAGLAVLRPRVTVLILGTNDGIGYAATRDPATLAALEAGLQRRAERATATGTCLAVPPARAHFPADVFARVRGAVERAARAGGCRIVPALDRFDDDASLTVDGVHPSPAGYRALAAALAPRILRAAGVRR